jgi:hypothetical protein
VYTRAGDWVYPAVLLKVFFSRTAAFLEGEESRPLVVILLKKKPTAFSRNQNGEKKEHL